MCLLISVVVDLHMRHRDRPHNHRCVVYAHIGTQIHSEVLVTYPPLVARLAELRTLQQTLWTRLEGRFHNSLCLVQFLSNLQV
jgi:hypothetical protein